MAVHSSLGWSPCLRVRHGDAAGTKGCLSLRSGSVFIRGPQMPGSCLFRH